MILPNIITSGASAAAKPTALPIASIIGSGILARAATTLSTTLINVVSGAASACNFDWSIVASVVITCLTWSAISMSAGTNWFASRIAKTSTSLLSFVRVYAQDSWRTSAIFACSPSSADAAATSRSESANAAPSSRASANAARCARTFPTSAAVSAALPPVVSIRRRTTPSSPSACSAASPVS